MEIQNQITQTLEQKFKPAFFEVVNESHSHNVARGSETHFKITLVSVHFEGLSRIKRQQEVYRALHSWIGQPIHALRMETWTPQEWVEQEGKSLAAPLCQGGSLREKKK